MRRPERRPGPARLAAVAAALVAALAGGGCGSGTQSVSAPASTDPVQEHRATALVVGTGGDVEICLGGAYDTYPPSCEGSPVVGWDWEAVDGEEVEGDLRWGTFEVVGTWDGERLTLTRTPAPPADPTGPDFGDVDLSTPCDPPPGGWAVVDPARADDDALRDAGAYARAQPGFAGSWVEEGIVAGAEGQADQVLTVRFTGDPGRHEAALRERWGGALCLAPAERSLAELQAVQQELSTELDALGSTIDVADGTVDVLVPVADDAVRREVAERYGEDIVHVEGRLQPVG